jgi:predicted transposase/invertase (TIGR01784 family)
MKFVDPKTDIAFKKIFAYLKSRLSYNEAKAVKDTAFSDGERKGKIEGKIEGATAKAIEIAKTMLAEGFEITTIAKITKLTHKEIEALK